MGLVGPITEAHAEGKVGLWEETDKVSFHAQNIPCCIIPAGASLPIFS